MYHTGSVNPSFAERTDRTGYRNAISTGSLGLSVTDNLVGITENINTAATFGLFPNPANGALILSSSGTQKVDYVISDLLGRKFVDGVFTERLTIDLSGLQKGTYFVRFESAGKISNQKLLVD